VNGVLEVTVAGFAVWHPQDRTRPQPSILPPNERRRAPDTVAIALEVAQRACMSAGREPSQLPMVFASTYGDLAITDYMCLTLARAPGTLSPTRFHNSVHNAAAGYWSMAAHCHEPYSAIGGGRYTFANGLFAAALQACADETDVLCVAYDIDARGSQTQIAYSEGILGVALVLVREGLGTRLALTLLPEPPVDAGFPSGCNAIADSLPLIRALESGSAAELRMPVGPSSTLQVRVSRPDRKSS
jgi:hypothetical protein